MKVLKFASLFAVLTIFVGCGHGYEGEYERKTASKNKFLNSIAGVVKTENIVIGSDYIDKKGVRTHYDNIFVRESGEASYLVFKDASGETVWTIQDENTLMTGNDLMSTMLVRVGES